MPSLSALREFKSSFGEIGNERTDLANRQIPYDELELPDTEPTPLETEPSPGAADTPAGTAPAGSPNLGFDDLDLPPLTDIPPMDDFGVPDGLLSGLTDDLSSPPDFPEEPPPDTEPPTDEPQASEPQPTEQSEGGSPPEGSPLDDFNMDDLLGGLDTPETPPPPEPQPTDVPEPESEAPVAEPQPSEQASEPQPTEQSEGGSPPEGSPLDFNMDDLLGNIPGLDTPSETDTPLPEPQPSEQASEPQPTEQSEGGSPLADLSGIDAFGTDADDDTKFDFGNEPLDLDEGMELGSESPEVGEGDALADDSSVEEAEPVSEEGAPLDFGSADDFGISDAAGKEKPAKKAPPKKAAPADSGDFSVPAADTGTDFGASDLAAPPDFGADTDTDFGAGADLGGADADTSALPEPQPSEFTSEGSPLDFGDFSIPDTDFGDASAGAGADVADDFSMPATDADTDFGTGDLGGGADTAGDFSIPDADLGGTDADTAPPEPQPSEFTSEGSPLDFGADFSIPDADLGAGTDLGAGDAAAPPDFGDFSIPDADLGVGTDLGAGDTAAPPEPQPSEFTSEGSPLDFGADFSIPDADSGTGEGTGTAATPPDTFDTFSFDEETPLTSDDAGSPTVDVGGDSTGGMGDIDLGDDPFASDMDFHLPGIDDLITAPGAAKTAAAKPGKTPIAAKGAEEEKVEEIKLTDEDLDKFVKTLTSYPLNLRIASEEVIAEQVVAPDLMSRMVKLLVNGAPAKETAALAGKILSRRIDIPKGYEKSSGEQLEKEQGSLAYIFVHSFLPILRLFAVIAVMVASVSYLVYQFIYKPVSADRLYKIGYERIFAGEYQRANERFSEAFNRHRKKDWFYKYAEAFRDERQYIYAEQKYDELLWYYPRDKKGILDYAYMETYYIRDYEKADRLLRQELLDYAPYDMEGLIAQGDNALAWGEIDPEKYEDARFAYARLLDRYGWRDPILERMMKYFIRTDNLKEVLPLHDYFAYDPKKKISADTLSELGGYLLDKILEETRGVPNEYVEKISGIRDLLLRAVAADPSLPESHYHLARYYQNLGNEHEERVTLENAIKNFDSAREESIRRLKYRIDAQRRYADNLIRSTEFFAAEESLVKGINLYEDALNRRLIQRSPEYGKMYSALGDLEYFTKRGDWQAALNYYHRSEMNGWCPPEVQYRMGSAYYQLEDWQNALKYLFTASSDLPFSRRLLFALGNASYQRGDNFAAQAYYNRLLEVLDSERTRLPLLLPNDRPDYLELAERIMMAMNNAGVVNELLAKQTGNANYRSRALGLYAESARAWDSLTRNPETMIRSGSRPIPQLNSQNILYPQGDYAPQIFVRIDRDVLEPSEWEALLNRVRPVESDSLSSTEQF